MKPRQQVSRAGLELIERFEGYRRKAAQLADGRWTIGYGHTLTARQGAEVSESDAEALLIYDMRAVATSVDELTFAPLSQNQFDALCAFAFNVGLDAFRASEVLKKVNEGALIEAACAMELWRKAEFQGEKIVVDGLVRRRAAEKLLFLTPPGAAWVPVPSAVLKPERDAAAAVLLPQEPPAPIITPLEGEAATPVRADAPEAVVPPAEESLPEPLPPLDPQPPEAPPEAAVEESPISAAAAAVAGRLSTIFQEEPAPAEIVAEPEAGAPPQPPSAEDAPFELTSPDAEPPGRDLPDLEFEAEREAPGEPTADLFAPPAANDAEAQAVQPEPELAEEPRVVIDDTAPYEFIPARVQPLPQRATEGYLSLVVTAVLGLAFFAGGLFWWANARSGPHAGVLTPQVVGVLASVAGVGLFSVAIYLFLQRLGEAAERDDRR
jgi:lysozyme